MAAIGQIRKRGTVLIIIIGLGLFAFIAEELFRSCEATQNEQRMQVGKVLGQKISVQEFSDLIEEYQEVIKLTQGLDNLTEDQTNQIKDQVWETFINTKLLEAEAKKIGLTVTDAELQEVLREGTHQMLLQTPFVNSQTGRFDATALTKFLADYNSGTMANTAYAEQYEALYKYWTFLEKNLRQQILASKYQTLILEGLLSNPIAAKAYHEGRNTESAIQLASLSYASVNDQDVEVTDADIKAKYEAKKELFRQYIESRDIKYVDVKVIASNEDRAELLETLNEAAAALDAGEQDVATIVRKAQSSILYTGLPVTLKAFPRDIAKKIDSMHVGEIANPFETKSDNTLNVIKLIAKTQLPDSVDYRSLQVVGATIDDARLRADSIYKALQGGADFETLAAAYGQEGTEELLTSAMYESTQTIDADTRTFLTEILTSPKGVIKNIEMPQGNIILQVTGRRNMVDKYTAAVIKHTIDFGKATYSAAYNKFSQYVSENQNLEGLEANAEKYGYRVLERKDIVNSEHTVVNVRGTREAMKWIFDAKEGDVSPLYECGENDHMLVLVLTKVHPEGYRDVADVRDILAAEVLKDKKFELLSGKLYDTKTVEDVAKVGGTLAEVEHITFSNPVFVQATGVSEPALSGAVTALSEGQQSELIKGNAGAYLFRVTARGTREGATEVNDEALVAAEAQLEKQATQAASRFMNELYLKANVVDNRYLFF